MPKAYSLLQLASAARAPAAEEWCTRHGLTMAVVASRGAAQRAPRALTDVLSFVHSGKIAKGSVLLVDRLDRMPPAEASASAHLLQKIAGCGITVVTLSDGVEHTRATLARDPTSLLYSVVGLMRANEERDLKSRRTRASWKDRRERAGKKEPISAICPAWLELDREAGAFRVNQERARVVQRVFRDALRGVGQAEIADALNQEGVRSFGRGTRWHRSYIVKLLRSPAVLGTYAPHTVEWVDGRRVRRPAGGGIRDYYPRIIEPDLFRQVQTLSRASRSPLRGRHAKEGKVVNVFGGLAHCGRCGASVTMVTKGKPPKAVRYLVCSAARVRTGCRRYQAIRYERFEEALLRERDWLLDTMPSGEQRADLDRLITEAEATAYRIGDQLESAERGGAGTRRSATRVAPIRSLKAERDKLRLLAESLRAERETTSATYVRDRVAALREALSAGPLDRTRVNVLLRQLFSAVTVDYEGDDLAFQWRHGGQSEVELGS
jgi:DNA invertase Pin-like site-specific DNA recombinase